uniref:V-set and immunoglobulin domain-containing protein 2-like n=1 Tax=Centroberyx gerrardi TaxID=166262 RepID=UPI003AAE58D7
MEIFIIFLFLLISALPCCRNMQVSIQEREYEVAKGDDIAMTCSFIPARPDFNVLILRWETLASSQNPTKLVATYFLNGPVNIAPDYEGRASLSVDVAKKESILRLSRVTQQDNRTFQCSVIIPNDDEGNTAATTSLLVLERPSKPICTMQGSAEYWSDISLTCMSEEGSPKPTYAWQSYSIQNIPRQFPLKTTEKDGVLSLFNISRETSGFFICMSTNRLGSASCNFTLAVMPSTMNIGATAGIIGGILAGILCLGVVIYCCCRKKNQKDKYAEGSPGEVEFHDRASPEAGEPYWDDKSNQTQPRIEQLNQSEEKGVPHQNNYSDDRGTDERKFEDDQHSYDSRKEGYDGKGNNVDNQHHVDDQHDRYGGSRDRLDDQRDRYRGSRDRLDDQRERYGGSRDRLDDQRERYGGSRDRLDDQRERYGGSRDRLDDQRDRYGGSRDRLDDQRDRYGGSRDRLDDQSDRYRSNRDDQRDRGSRDRLDYSDDRFVESREPYVQQDRYGNRYD